MRLPTFFILGAARCGTTALHYYLGQHPDFCMSRPKEPYFFEADYGRGLQFYMETYFSHWNGQRHIGEARQRNLYLPWVAERIAESIPEPRFIVLVRNPVERAVSHWWYNFSRGQERDGFRKAIEKDLDRVRRGEFVTPERYARNLVRNTGISTYPGYVDTGHYADQIERYDRTFGSNRVLVLLTEDLEVDRAGTLARVLSFLGAETCELTDLQKQNTALPELATRFLARYRGVRHRLRRGSGKEDPARDRLERFVEQTFGNHRPRADGHTKMMLTQHYAAHNEKLSARLNRDLSHWNGPPCIGRVRRAEQNKILPL